MTLWMLIGSSLVMASTPLRSREQARQMTSNIFQLQDSVKMVLAYTAITQIMWYGSDFWICTYYEWKRKEYENLATCATYSATDKEACHCDDYGLHFFFGLQSVPSLQLVAIANRRAIQLQRVHNLRQVPLFFSTQVHLQYVSMSEENIKEENV